MFAAATAATLTLTVLPAAAQDAPLAEATRNQRARHILERLDESSVRDVREAEARWRSNFGIEQTGPEYRRALTMGERSMIFSVHPMFDKKTYGLSFQIRF